MIAVAPYMGAWIETETQDDNGDETHVAPYMGAWIETLIDEMVYGGAESLPIWERGLKPTDGGE